MSIVKEYILEELLLARTSRDLSQEEFGKKIGYSGSHVSSVETSGRPPTPEYVAAIDRAFQTGGRYTRMLIKLAKLEGAPVWLRAWIEFEAEAIALRWFEPLYVPGLLQTEAYARATLAGGRYTADEISDLVTSRMERQGILRRAEPPQFIAVMDEAVIRRPVRGQPDLMREQLETIVASIEEGLAQVHVVPFDAGMYLGLGGPFIIAESADGTRVAHADNQIDARIIDTPADVARLTKTWEHVRSLALPGLQSLDLIKEAAKTWT